MNTHTMIDFTEIDALDGSLNPTPRFPVEPIDKGAASELQRQATFRKMMTILAPNVLVYANTNGTHIASFAGRAKANKEGRTIGCPDITVVWNRGVAWLEFKAGKGAMKPAQVEFCNRLVDMGQHVACFRTPDAAVEWLRGLGVPVRAMNSGSGR